MKSVANADARTPTPHRRATKPAQPLLISRSFRDPDEFAVAAKEWDFGCLQLDHGPLKVDLLMFRTGTASMTRFAYSRKLLGWGTSPEGMRTFGLPDSLGAGARWCGHAMDPTTLNVFSASGDFEAVSEPGFSSFNVSFTSQHFAAIERTLDVPPIEEFTGDAGHVASCDARKLDAARGALRRAYGQLHAGVQGPALQAVVEELDFEIPKRLLLALWSSAPVKRPRPQRIRDVAFRRALALIDEHACAAITVQEVCRLAGVSWRTLDYAFRERFGVTPKAYIKATRLNAAHRALKFAPAGAKISEIASFWGFWHMGQFAADHRRMFGELPSQTLAR